jgi:hypothetical protein
MRILPARWPDRYRCTVGGVLASGCAAALALPRPAAAMTLRLGLLGVGLGTLFPANNSSVMTAVPLQAAAAGGMVNMAGGTALGVATVTVAPHAAARLGRPRSGPAAAMAVLVATALVTTWAGRRDSSARWAGVRIHGAGRR